MGALVVLSYTLDPPLGSGIGMQASAVLAAVEVGAPMATMVALTMPTFSDWVRRTGAGVAPAQSFTS